MDPQYPLHVKGKKPEALSFGAVRSLSPRIQQMILIPGKEGGGVDVYACCMARWYRAGFYKPPK